MKNINFSSFEKYFFILIIGLNLIPIFLGKFFPTLDGAAHLYNSLLIQTLLFNNHDLLNAFFVFNPEPVPNWTGHIILSFFNTLLPGYTAEKILLLFYLIGLPLAFRALITTISPKNQSFSYIIFPFTYSFPFFLGFYNFSIALIFMLITINFWIRNNDKLSSLKILLKLFLLISLTYFSHIFVFGILLFLIGLHMSVKAIIQILNNLNHTTKILNDFFRTFGLLLLTSSTSLILFSYYFYSRQTEGIDVFIPHKELIDWLTTIRPIIALNFIIEQEYTGLIFYLLFSIAIIVIYNRINDVLAYKNDSIQNRWTNFIQSNIRISDAWLFASIVVLFLYFKLPDSDGYAGFVSVRLGLLFFLFFIVWLATHEIHKWFGILIIGTILYCNLQLNIYYISATKDLNKVAIECNNASEHILPNSIVLPVNYSENWLHKHFSNYLGIDKPMVILENYECGTDYFPLMWNYNSIPNLMLGNTGLDNFTCLQFKSNAQNPSKEIDYVFVLRDMDSKSEPCDQRLEQVLIEQFVQIFSSDNCKLYKRKNL